MSNPQLNSVSVVQWTTQLFSVPAKRRAVLEATAGLLLVVFSISGILLDNPYHLREDNPTVWVVPPSHTLAEDPSSRR